MDVTPLTAALAASATTSSRDLPALEARDLYRFYHVGGDETLALQGVSLQLHPGEIVAVTGPSGSGKSTLLACLAGLDEPDGGTVHIDGQVMSRRSEAERSRLRASTIGILFQTGNLVDHLTVEQNLLLTQRLAGPANRGAARAVLESVGLSDRAGSMPATLSGGEAARAGLAVALANDPSVILADEPTGELDGGTADRLMALLRSRADAGAAVLIVTHDPARSSVADRQIVLRGGRIDPSETP